MDVDSEEVKAACARFGWPGLRPIQAEVVAPVLAGENVLAVLPTSAGKSLCYQVPAVARPGLVLVISPLIALMIDQVDALRAKGIEAAALHSHVSAAEKKRIHESISNGTLKLLYVSPERLNGLDPLFFKGSTLSMVAVDEAHCISEWGHDFRPAYLRVGRGIRRLSPAGAPPPQVLALTATATPEVIDEIDRLLTPPGLSTMTRVIHSPERTNLFYGVAGRDVPLLRLIGRAEERVGLPALVYGSTRIGVEVAAEELRRAGYRAKHYHAEMNGEERSAVQAAFAGGDLDVIAATCAFGMGIDNRRLRCVIHTEMSTSLEAYVQEAGRAGRDGRPSLAICRATEETLAVASSMVPMAWPTPERVRRFWRLIEPQFEARPGKAEAEGEWSTTTNDLSRMTGYDATEASSALRILVDSGWISRISATERPCKVVLLSAAEQLKGVRQRAVLDALMDRADLDGEVAGSVAFFQNAVGLDKALADNLVERGAIRCSWAEHGSLLRIVGEGRPKLDDVKIRAIARRQTERIEAARGYLYARGCRRSYLLDYFGEGFAALADPGHCCDRCSGGHGRKTSEISA